MATEDFRNYELIGDLSKDIGTPMKGIEISKMAESELMAVRGV